MHHGIGPFQKWKGITRFGNLSKNGSLPVMFRVEAVGIKSSNYALKITIFVKCEI